MDGAFGGDDDVDGGGEGYGSDGFAVCFAVRCGGAGYDAAVDAAERMAEEMETGWIRGAYVGVGEALIP